MITKKYLNRFEEAKEDSMDVDFEKRMRAVEMPHRVLAQMIQVYLLTHRQEFKEDLRVIDIFEDPWTKNLVATIYSKDFEPNRLEGMQLPIVAKLG
jgi:hypothetical protein